MIAGTRSRDDPEASSRERVPGRGTSNPSSPSPPKQVPSRLSGSLRARPDQFTPYFGGSHSCRETANVQPVCPPMVGSSASGRSRSMIFPMISG